MEPIGEPRLAIGGGDPNLEENERVRYRMSAIDPGLGRSGGCVQAVTGRRRTEREGGEKWWKGERTQEGAGDRFVDVGRAPRRLVGMVYGGFRVAFIACKYRAATGVLGNDLFDFLGG